MFAEPPHAPTPLQELQRAVALAALGLLVVSSLAGLWMATLLIWPGIGALAGSLTYGRWAPVHLDLQLYGWCSLPAVGVLMKRLLPPSARATARARLALAVWSGALAAGAVSWLLGHASGKLFLNWSGSAEIVFGLAQVFLWLVLADGWRERGKLGSDGRLRRLGDAALLLVLLPVPIALHVAARPAVYPPVNPESGGATGHSLLASTLGIIAIALILPVLLSRPRQACWRRAAGATAALFAASLLVYLGIDHGNTSHHAPDQIAGLAVLLPWPAALLAWYRCHRWEASHRLWLGSAAFWSILLVVDGFLLFLPGALEVTKFTNALVGHAHLAMAGLVTSLNLLMLISLAPGSRLAQGLASAGPWLAWNAACLAMVVALSVLGCLEGGWMSGGILERTVIQDFYVVRWLSGGAMVAAAVVWLAHAVLRQSEVSLPNGHKPAPQPGVPDVSKHALLA